MPTSETEKPFVIEAGRLRHTGEIIQKLRTADGVGGSSESPSVFKTVACAVRPLNGRELYIATQQKMAVSVAIDMRFTEGITNAMWIKVAGLNYAIRAVLDLELRNRRITLLTEQRNDLK